jgi:lysylphosphatidylglycerol synthetase-like protein (DUF2156 family)
MRRRRLVEHVGLLLWTAPLAALVVAAIVAVAMIDTAWAVALACGALVAAAAAMAVVTGSFLRDEDGADSETPRSSTRWSVLALAAVATAAITVAFLGGRHDEVAAATASDSSATAERTVRDFLVAAYVDGDGEVACGFLSQDEQHQVAITEPSMRCGDALSGPASPSQLAALTTSQQVRDLPARVQPSNGGATVRVGGGVFLLRPATAKEQAQFNAPADYWRIADGVTALLRAG